METKIFSSVISKFLPGWARLKQFIRIVLHQQIIISSGSNFVLSPAAHSYQRRGWSRLESIGVGIVWSTLRLDFSSLRLQYCFFSKSFHQPAWYHHINVILYVKCMLTWDSRADKLGWCLSVRDGRTTKRRTAGAQQLPTNRSRAWLDLLHS